MTHSAGEETESWGESVTWLGSHRRKGRQQDLNLGGPDSGNGALSLALPSKSCLEPGTPPPMNSR